MVFAGRLKEDHEFNPLHPLGVRVYYDPEPRALTQGQLIRTSCYGEGEIIAKVYPPSPLFLENSESTTTVREPTCTDPYEISASVRRPYTQADTAKAWKDCREESQRIKNRSAFDIPRGEGAWWLRSGQEHSAMSVLAYGGILAGWTLTMAVAETTTRDAAGGAEPPFSAVLGVRPRPARRWPEGSTLQPRLPARARSPGRRAETAS